MTPLGSCPSLHPSFTCHTGWISLVLLLDFSYSRVFLKIGFIYFFVITKSLRSLTCTTVMKWNYTNKCQLPLCFGHSCYYRSSQGDCAVSPVSPPTQSSSESSTRDCPRHFCLLQRFFAVLGVL